MATVRRRTAVLRDVLRHARRGPAPLPDPEPLVTVVIATYNYSSVLRHSIRSVLRQSHRNLELLVVGDACTDDSEEVVASFDDPRVRWVNREENAGSQSGPNNTGIELAAGTYVAYLGHDDLWHPHHLSTVVGALERSGAPVAHTLIEVIGPPGSRLKLLGGLSPGDRELGRWLAPTSLAHRTEVGRRVPWRAYTESFDPPDIDFLDRVQLAVGPPLRVHALTAFKFSASWRPNCYRDRPDHEQATWSRRLETEPRFLERELASLLLHRLSPFHAKLPPLPKRPADAKPGWLTVHTRRVRGVD